MQERDSAHLDGYLGRLDKELGELSSAERREIVLETRSHVNDKLERDPSLSVDSILADLGAPEKYAVGFLPERQRAGALNDLATVTTSGWKSTPLLMLVIGAYGIAALCVFVGIAKILEPGATGLYVKDIGQRQSWGISISDPNHGGRDVLGLWLVPISFGIAAVFHFLISRLLRRFARRR